MNLHLKQAIILFFAGIGGGTLNAIAGGGSFICFPALLFTGVPAVQANATNTIALWPGLATSMAAYLKRLSAPASLLIPLLVTSVAGGWAGAFLLLHTPQRTFVHLIPWLISGGTFLFAFGNQIRGLIGKTSTIDNQDRLAWQTIAAASFLNTMVAIYGGYFGAGMGFVLMAMMALIGMKDIHAMAALRTLLAAAINAAAVVTFILARAVWWPQGIVMIVGASAGGWFGAHFAQKADPQKMRYLVIGIGLAMAIYFFITIR